jgi:hypothetical protein
MKTLALLFLASAAQASAPHSAEEYCGMVRDLAQFKSLAADADNLMAFENNGGLLDGGVCWWHSRFQRAALYLTFYRPDLPKPNDQQAREIIDAIAGKKHVVMIPGFSNFREFSGEYQDLIQAKLDRWQIEDGFLKQYWIDGLAGSVTRNPDAFERSMDALAHRVNDLHEIVYQKLQLPGIYSHAWLVVRMDPTPEGYDLQVLDSNLIGLQSYGYTRGMGAFEYDGFGLFSPYTEQDGELVDAQVEMLRFCNPALAYQRWAQALDRAFGDADPGTRQLIDYNLELARDKGQFSDILRKETLTDQDRIPANWAKLFSTGPFGWRS